MLVPIFSLDFGHKIQPRLATVGYFDGKHPCLTCATTAGKVFIHNPHGRSEYVGRMERASQSDVSLLSINQGISSLTSGSLGEKNDALMIGSRTNLLVYDVFNNRDLFYKDMADGANAIAVGRLGSYQRPMVIVGGNCSIQGYDQQGDDSFWTVTGDNVTCLSLLDFTMNGQLELVVGSEDFDLRVFREDEIIAEMTETEVISEVCDMGSSKFGYALANGTVGVYERASRNWRIKSKNQAMTIHAFDIDGDGIKELITGWSNGKIDARSDRTGEVIFKDNLQSAVAAIVNADYRMEGRDLLICCSTEGKVQGFHCSSHQLKGTLLDASVEQEAVRELSQRRQNLQMELKNYEENEKAANMARPSGLGHLDQPKMGIIPANTQLQTTLLLNRGSEKLPPHVELQVSTTNDTIIKAVIIFAEGIFDGESFVVHPHPDKLGSSVKVPIIPARDQAVDLHIKALIGTAKSSQFHVFELTRVLPRFSMYDYLTQPVELPKSSVTFKLNERTNRVVMWINENFLLSDDIEPKIPLNLNFVSLRGTGPFVIKMDSVGEVVLHTDDMELAGDFIQSIASALNIQNLNSFAEYPTEMENLRQVLVKVDEFHATRQRLTSEIADHSNLVKSLVVRAEDARLLGNMRSMRKGYQSLLDLNRDLINGYRIRCNNHEELLHCLKQVNQTIQRAAKLRVGKHKTEVVNACRAAIKSNNVATLFKVIKAGV